VRLRLKAAVAVTVLVIAVTASTAALVPSAEPKPAQADFTSCVTQSVNSWFYRHAVGRLQRLFLENPLITLHCAFVD